MKYISILLLLTLAACGMPECRNANPVFDKNTPNSTAYNAELVKELKANADGLSYWVNDYAVAGADTFIVVYVRGKTLCADMWMNVNGVSDGKLQNLKEKKAVSYSGAELVGLKYKTVQDSNNYRFLYEKLDRISD